MKFQNVDFDTYFRNYPDANGYFGKYGGSYIPPQLQAAMNEITDAYMTICKSSKFVNELRRIRRETGEPHSIRGIETQIYVREKGKWKLMYVHYAAER